MSHEEAVARYHAAYLKARDDRDRTHEERKEATQVAEAQLKAARAKTDAANKEVDGRLKELQRFAFGSLINRAVVDVLVPDHDRTSCSDDNLANSDGRCTRCMLLDALAHPHGSFIDDHTLGMTVSRDK